MRKKKISYSLLAVWLLMNISGCAPLIIGGALGAVGGYAASKDTIQGETDKDYDTLWSAAIMVSRIRGKIKREDAANGYIEFTEGANKVWVKLIKLTQATTRLKVSARKYHFPNLGLAQELFIKIMEEVK